jgi:hypothetical protein
MSRVRTETTECYAETPEGKQLAGLKLVANGRKHRAHALGIG